ncbi:MAG: hypothetical protein ACLGI5_15030 [Thermoleophilia bacterium]
MSVDASQIISIVALVVSLTAAVFSYRLSRRSFKVSAYHGASDRTLQMDQVFIAHPLLRPYFYDREPVPAPDCPDRELRQRVLAVAEFVTDILEDCWDNEDCYAGPDRDAWRDWIYDVFEGSPACCEHYACNMSWYPTLSRLFAAEGAPPEGVRRAAAQEPRSNAYERTSSQTSIE